MTKRKVLITIALIAVAILAWDAMLYADNVPGNSITQVIRSIVEGSPLAAGALGFFLGAIFMHFFDTTEQK